MLRLLRYLIAAVSLAFIAAHSRVSADCESNRARFSIKCYKSGNWCVAETENFQACATDSDRTALELAEAAEKLRADLREKWLGESPDGAEAKSHWAPKCQIVLH